jgi:hypothetical protein
LKIARIVTGSVADKVAPTLIASTKGILMDSKGSWAQRNIMIPNVHADMKVPAKAKVNIEPIFRKKFA